MVAAGIVVIAYSVWRYRNPGWRDDAFWKRHDRLRDWLAPTGLPRRLARRLPSQRVERIAGVFGVAWGLLGMFAGAAMSVGLI
jgi:hypothetical protein